ncbi:hypothetical protein OHB54_16875 [Streptomyces sp. NBC_01007]|nr:hypothetical protein OHB54_16875 [Streptomyces sp. NBC_01007]
MIVTLIGLGLVIFTHWDQAAEAKNYSPLLGGVGEAIFVAGILGLTLDQALKAQLVKDVAAEALKRSWGVNAPQEYIENLSNSLDSYDRIILALEVRLEFAVHDAAQGILRVNIKTRAVVQNISGDAGKTHLPAADSSIHGAPDSSIESLELTVRNPPAGQRAPAEIHRTWDSAELETAYERDPTGALKVKKDFDVSAWRFTVEPGGTSETRYASTVYCRTEDTVTLVSPAPALSWEFHVGGNEVLNDLSVRSYVGGDAMKFDPAERGLHGAHGFTHAGVAIQIAWSPRREEHDVVPEVEERELPGLVRRIPALASWVKSLRAASDGSATQGTPTPQVDATAPSEHGDADQQPDR